MGFEQAFRDELQVASYPRTGNVELVACFCVDIPKASIFLPSFYIGWIKNHADVMIPINTF